MTFTHIPSFHGWMTFRPSAILSPWHFTISHTDTHTQRHTHPHTHTLDWLSRSKCSMQRKTWDVQTEMKETKKIFFRRERTRCEGDDGMKLCTIRLSVCLARQSAQQAGLSRLWVTSRRQLKGSRADGDTRSGASDLSRLTRILSTGTVNLPQYDTWEAPATRPVTEFVFLLQFVCKINISKNWLLWLLPHVPFSFCWTESVGVCMCVCVVFHVQQSGGNFHDTNSCSPRLLPSLAVDHRARVPPFKTVFIVFIVCVPWGISLFSFKGHKLTEPRAILLCIQIFVRHIRNGCRLNWSSVLFSERSHLGFWFDFWLLKFRFTQHVKFLTLFIYLCLCNNLTIINNFLLSPRHIWDLISLPFPLTSRL